MPRKTPRLDLTLLLVVVPLVAACDGPEDRHCVGEDSIYLEDQDCDPAGPAYRAGAHWVYVPRRHYLGPGGHAGGYFHATSPGRGGSSGVARGGFGSTGAGHAGGA